MAPLQELHAAQDEIAAWSVTHAARFAPIPCPAPDERKPVRMVPPHLTTPSRNLIDVFAALPDASLKVEARALQARMLGPEYSTRDFAIVSALVHRLEASHG